MNKKFALENQIEVLAGKPRSQLTKEDIINLINERQIERLTFHYTAIDGKVKELRLPITSKEQAEIILAEGERVDGSSLFKNVVDAGESDLYVIPVYKTAFINPFDDRSLDFICRFVTGDGELAPFAPDNLLHITHLALKEETGIDFYALGELEFYLVGNTGENLYPLQNQKGYHGSSPHVKTTDIVNEMLRIMTNITSEIKYAHNEVGLINRLECEHPLYKDKPAEQVEIEFLPSPVEDAADVVVLGKWLCQSVANRHGLIATFYPKIQLGAAGSGLHFHTMLKKGGRNIMLGEDRELSEDALKLIGGLCRYAPTLSAFGNMTAASFLRLVPHQEAPTKVCWGYSNRSALVRVPLGWRNLDNLAMKVNPQQKLKSDVRDSRQTVELRSPDGSANTHLLLAGMTTALLWAYRHPEEALELAKKNFVAGNIHDDSELEAGLIDIATSCVETAETLSENRNLYTEEGYFPEPLIDKVARMLNAQNDRGLNRSILELPPEEGEKIAKDYILKGLENS
ncbi:MAG: glutamine synthetase beta-grasp domain-containing protein [Spirochaetota bacterium]